MASDSSTPYAPEIKEAFISDIKFLKAKGKIKKLPHAEMQIIEHIENNNDIKDTDIYIGISKLTCKKCNAAIVAYNTLNEKNIKFIARGSHYTSYDVWTEPKFLDDKLKKHYEKTLKEDREQRKHDPNPSDSEPELSYCSRVKRYVEHGIINLLCASREKRREVIEEIQNKLYQDKIARITDLINQELKFNGEKLIRAIKLGDQPTIAGLLSSKNLLINAQDNDGNTALHTAVIVEDINTIELLSKHADIIIDIKNFQGKTPLEIINENSTNYRLIKELITHRVTEIEKFTQDLKEILTSKPIPNKIYDPLLLDSAGSKKYINIAVLYNNYQKQFIQDNRPESLFKYIKNYNALLKEGDKYHSLREKHILAIHESKEQQILNNIEHILLEGEKPLAWPAQSFMIMGNEYSLVVLKNQSKYAIYSSDFNKQALYLKEDLSFSSFLEFANNFFQFKEGINQYKFYIINSNYDLSLTEALTLHPHDIFSDYKLFSYGKIPGVKNDFDSKELVLAKYGLRNKDIKKLSLIKSLKSIEKLDVSYNHIGNKGLKYILNSKSLSGLKELKISSNSLHLEHQGSYNFQRLNKIDLRYNSISSEFIKLFYEKYHNIDLVVDGRNSFNIKGIMSYDIDLQMMPDYIKKTHVSTTLKSKIVSTLEVYNIFNTVNTIRFSCENGEVGSCAYSVASMGSQFLSRPIEKIMVKTTTYFVNQGMNNINKLASIKGIHIEFIAKVNTGKYIVKFAKAGGAVILALFDLVDLAQASYHLYECYNIKSCSDKEIRDYIAAISFISLSVISGVTIAMYKAGPVGVIIGTALFVGYNIYNGISNVKEYQENYKTIASEDWKIFFSTIFMIDTPTDIKELVNRVEYVKALTNHAKENLSKLPDNIIGYAYGLGQLDKITEEYQGRCGRPPVFVVCTQYKTRIEFATGSAVIKMHNKHINYKLSRVLPKQEQDISYICLPKQTRDSYEKTNMIGDTPNYCENSVVMTNTTRLANNPERPAIIYDFTYIDRGGVSGSDLYNNIFYVYKGSSFIIGGRHNINEFVLNNINYRGKILLGYNSTNIINTTNLKNQIITVKLQDSTNSYKQINIKFANQHSINIENTHRAHSISYKSTRFTEDIVYCDITDINDDINVKNNFLVNTGGGINAARPDKLFNCVNAVISPNTLVYGEKESNYNYYIKTLNDNKEGISSLNLRGNSTITFIDNILLNDCQRILYHAGNDTLSIEIPIKHNAKIFAINILNYLNQSTNNISLIDKYGSIIVPNIQNNTHIVSEFGVYAQGNNGADTYQIGDISNQTNLIINNFAEDLELDIIYLPSSSVSYIEQNQDDLAVSLLFDDQHKILTFVHYYKSPEYQHLIFVHEEHNSFIPFKHNDQIKLVPFYYKKYAEVAPKTEVAVINGRYEDISIYKAKNDAIIEVDDRKNSQSKIFVIFKDFHIDNSKWDNITLYTYENGIIDVSNNLTIFDLQQTTRILDIEGQIVSNFKTYNIQFHKNVELYPNLKWLDGKLQYVNVSEEKIELIGFYEIYPKDIKIISEDEFTILVHKHLGNTCTIYHPYKSYLNNDINIFEFNFAALNNSIKIYNHFNSIYSLAEKFNIAQKLYRAYMDTKKLGFVKDCFDEFTLKCVLSYKHIDHIELYQDLSQIFGFGSIGKYIHYIKNCQFTSSQLNALQGCITKPLLEKYKFILENNLKLQFYTSEEINYLDQVINRDLIPEGAQDQIIETINKLLVIYDSTSSVQYIDIYESRNEEEALEIAGKNATNLAFISI